jgi:Tfp pilus assembly PilM family ATPase
MPQLLALEWDGSEARLAVASTRGDQVLIEQAFAVELRPRESAGEKSEVDIGARLASALGARGLGRLDTLVAVGRTNIELRQLLLPPAPDDELPDLVRFQAMREFNEFDEKWLLDFVPLGDLPEEPRTVLAAAIGPELVGQIQQTCESAGLKPRRLVLRACAAASLLARAESARQGELRLLIDFLSDEADLTVMSDGRVVFLRTTRLGGDPPQPQVLLGEVRRTMAAVQNQLGGRKVDSIVFCGKGEQQAELARRIEKELSVPTELFDPFQGLKLGEELRSASPEHPGRFAPLLGLLTAELEHTGHAVDFLHPRRRQEKPRKWKRYVLPAIAAAVFLIGYFGYQQIVSAGLNSDILDLTVKLKKLEDVDKENIKWQGTLKAIDKWVATDVCWLDELAEMSRKFPPAEQAMLTKMTVSQHLKGGEITLDGLARDLTAINKIEQTMHDPAHQVFGRGASHDDKIKPYVLQFNGSIVISTDALAKTANAPAQQKSKTPPAQQKSKAAQATPKSDAAAESQKPDAAAAQQKSDAAAESKKSDAAAAQQKSDAAPSQPKSDSAESRPKSDAAESQPKSDAEAESQKPDAAAAQPKSDEVEQPQKKE